MFRALPLTRFSRPGQLGICALLLGLAACNTNKPSSEDIERQREVHIDSARAYINMGEYARAEDQAQRGLSLVPGDIDLELALARSLQMQGTTAKILHAEAIYRELPRDEDYRVPLGYAETLERKGLAYSEAAEAVRAGDRPVPNIEETAGKLEEQAGKAWALSAQIFHDGLEMKPGNTELMNGLGRVYALMGDFEEALTWCQATLDIVQNDHQFWVKQLKRVDLTVDEEERFRAALARLDTLEIGLRLLAANIEVRLDDNESAVEHLGKVIELEPTLAQAYSLRASLLMEMGRYEEVVADIDAFLGRTDLPFENEDVKRAFDLRTLAEAELRASATAIDG